VAGQRTTVLVIRMDTRSPDTTAGLMWRTDTAAAVAAATRPSRGHFAKTAAAQSR
jgi:hypothetical protein